MEPKPCGLIAAVPPSLQIEWAEGLAALTKRFRPAALVLISAPADLLARIVAAASPLELAVLVAGDAEAALDAGANGVYLGGGGAGVGKARSVLGSAAVIGAACGLSRHAAMEHAEAGADFISFDAADPSALETAAALSSWWDEITGVPVALDFGKMRPSSTLHSQARPDFLLLEECGRAGESLTFATEFGLQSQP